MGTVSEELSRLADLHDRGILTDSEFADQKAHLLNENAGFAITMRSGLGVFGWCMLGVTAFCVLIAALDIFRSPQVDLVGESNPSQNDSKPTPSVSMETYNAVQPGMTYDQVVAIVGKPTQEMSHSQFANTETVMYMWSGGLGSNMNMIFQNGALVQKAQFGLR